MSINIHTDNPRESREFTTSQIEALNFLFCRTDEYRFYMPFAYRDMSGEGRFCGYAGALCSNDLTDDSLEVEFPTDTDVYICPNGMKFPFSRKASNMICIQNLVVDIDAHNTLLSTTDLNAHIDSFTDKLMTRLNPKPNFVNHTGRGIQLWYCIEPCHIALKHICLKAASLLCDQIAKHMAGLGETVLSLDKSSSLRLNGLFRLPYTYNTKAKRWATGTLIHQSSPNVNELLETLTEKPQFSNHFVIKNQENSKKPIIPHKQYTYRKNIFTKDYYPCLIHRKKFLEHLFRTRTIDEGSRDLMLFALYSVVSALMATEDAQDYVLQMNSQLPQPLPESQIYCCIFKEIDRKRYRFTNKRLLSFVNATQEEIDYFNRSTIKRERTAAAAQRKKDRNNLIMELYNAGRPVAAIAREVGCSRITVYSVIDSQKV